MGKFLLCLVIWLTGAGAITVWEVGLEPAINSEVSLRHTVHPDRASNIAVRGVQRTQAVPGIIVGGCFLLTLVMYWRDLMKYGKQLTMAGLILAVMMSTGCALKPFNKRVQLDKGSSEVLIQIATHDNNGVAIVAAKGNSEDGENILATNNNDAEIQRYESNLVDEAVVFVPYYWETTANKRWWHMFSYTPGEWKPAAKYLIIDTEPETREWTPDENTGTSTSDQAIWVESRDSVGFSTGFSCTARIDTADDAINFLVNYKAREHRDIAVGPGQVAPIVKVSRLEQIMDTEVRTKIQEIYAIACNSYDMDVLRDEKNYILELVKNGGQVTIPATKDDAGNEIKPAKVIEIEGVIPFFGDRGITITSIGQFGGFTYENPKIQESIDLVFQEQQDKEVALAESEAAEIRKEALRLQGEGEAQKAEEVARGKAEAVKLAANAEAEAIQAVADAKAYEIQKANEDLQTYLELKRLEIESQRLEAWDGRYPQTILGGDSNAVPLFSLPQNK